MAVAHPDELERMTQLDMRQLQRHMEGLGLESIEAYLAWCRDWGFPARLIKNAAERRKETDAFGRRAGDAALKRSRRVRRPEKLLDEVFDGSADPDRLPEAYRLVHEALGTLGRRKGTRAAYERLVRHAASCSDLIREGPVVTAYPQDIHNTLVGALASLATHHAAWLNAPEAWKPATHNPRRQLGALARHLLAKYDVPPFMDSVWFKRSRTQTWFVHLGMGKNIRTAERLPVELTRKMAHQFLQAPKDYTVEHALRWAQILGLGGNARVVEGVRGTRLGRRFADEAFWIGVMRFFIANPMLDVRHYGPIVDYIQHQKFEHRDVPVAPGQVERQPPPHPGFSMRRRTPDSLLRSVEAWHRALGRARVHEHPFWAPSGIRAFEWTEGGGRAGSRRWVIQELVSAEELVDEGRVMRHCVASYAASCAADAISIWSLRCETERASERVLTIEVRNKGRLVTEARGRFNAYPSEKAMAVVRRWASREGLQVPAYVAG